MGHQRPLPEGISKAIRYDFSTDHNWSARHLAKVAVELEKAGDTSKEPYQNHRACVVGSVMATVAFLESTINELFSDCEAKVWVHQEREISQVDRDALGQIWSREIRLLSTLRKYDLALAVLRYPSFDRSVDPYSSIKTLISLRNKLVHFEPEWIPLARSDGKPLQQNQLHPLEQSLAPRFACNALADSKWSFWPERCLGAGCASWAINSAEAFVTEFIRILTAPAT